MRQHARGDVLCERARARAEDLVAGREIGDVLPHRLDDAGEVAADQLRLRPTEAAHHRPQQDHRCRDAVVVAAVDRRRPHSYEHPVVGEQGHQPRVELRKPRIVELEIGHRAGPQVLDQHVRALRELAENLFSFRGLEIQRQRPLVAVEPDEARRLAVEEGRCGANLIAAVGVLDLDHVGAQIGEDLPRPRPGQDARKLENADTGKRSGHGGLLYG